MELKLEIRSTYLHSPSAHPGMWGHFPAFYSTTNSTILVTEERFSICSQFSVSLHGHFLANLLGETLKLPALARQDGSHLYELS